MNNKQEKILLYHKAMIAGFLIGLGVIINSLIDIPFLGALLFSFGLLTIIYLKLPLYTGKIGFIGKGQYPPFDLFIILLGNLIGVIFCTFIYRLANSDFIFIIEKTGNLKFAKGYISILCFSFFCGTLIHFAVKTKNQVCTIMAIMIFILIGAEHCIAIFPYFIYNVSWVRLVKFLLVILGNSIGAIYIELLTEN